VSPCCYMAGMADGITAITVIMNSVRKRYAVRIAHAYCTAPSVARSLLLVIMRNLQSLS